MIWTLSPWLFHFIVSLLLLSAAFVIGWLLTKWVRKRKENHKQMERFLAIVVTVTMIGLYFLITEVLTESAGYQDAVITEDGAEVMDSPVVIVPFESYVIAESLYWPAYVRELSPDGENEAVFYFEPASAETLLEETGYIEGEGRPRFQYEVWFAQEVEPLLAEIEAASAETADELDETLEHWDVFIEQ